VIPGSIAKADVSINGNTVSFATSGFGTIAANGRSIDQAIDLTSSPLFALATDTVTISNIGNDPGVPLPNFYNIGELEIFGTPAAAVPEPATLSLFAASLLGFWLIRTRKDGQRASRLG